MNERNSNRLLGFGFVFLLCSLLPLACVQAQQDAGDGDAALRQEFMYIELLQQMRMPDIADEVIAEAKKHYPEAAAKFKVSEIQGLLSQGKFDDVKKLVDAIKDKNSPEFWALTLAMADAYYAFQKYADADKLYLGFFKNVDKPSPALVAFYRDAAYKYAQMLLYLGKDREALDAYRRIFKVPLEEEVARQIHADMAELMLKMAPDLQNKEEKAALLKEAEGLIDKLLWKQDIWFGKAIVMKAHIFLLRGNVKGAQELVDTYMPQLKIIHDSLLEADKDGSLGQLRMSPMPQCRYLLALLLMNEALAEAKKPGGNDEHIKDLLLGERDPQTKQRKNNGAFAHFVNVFIRFPESQWAAEAGERSEVIRKFVKDRYGADLRTPVTAEQMAKVRQMQFAGARLVFSQNQFKEAIEKYLLVLNQFPESPESIPALGDLAVSYIEFADKDPDALLLADTVTAHLSERFSANAKLMKDAGDQVRRIAEHFGEMKMEDKKRQTYALFFRDYPAHHAAGQLVMSFGEREFEAKNYAGAMGFYKQVAEIYTNSPYYFDALNRMTQVYKEEGDSTNEMQMLSFYIARLSERAHPGNAWVLGRFRLAEAQREYGVKLARSASTNENSEAVQKEAAMWIEQAKQGFVGVAKVLSESAAAYQTNEEEKKRNEQMLDLATFSKAVCLTQTAYPQEKLPALRKEALAAFEEYVKRYPKGAQAAKAQLQIGTIYTVLQEVPGAQAAFEKLSKNYPDSPEAKNSVPMLAASLIDMGLRAEGVAKYREMFAAGGTYTESQFMAAAQALEEAKEYDMAFQAYEKLLATAKDLSLVANGKLGRARVLAGQKKYPEARKSLNEFMADKALSKLQLVVDANLLLVEVASEEGKLERDDNERTRLFNVAVDALKMVRKYRKEPEEIAALELAAGEIMLRKMDAEKKLGLTTQAGESRGKAIVAFQVMILNMDPGNAKQAAILEKAYFYCVPLLLDHKKAKDAQEDCETYLRIFPNGRYTTDIQNCLNQAKVGQ
ncbi:MAG: tetratricopeptide repeat protein [bacterium]